MRISTYFYLTVLVSASFLMQCGSSDSSQAVNASSRLTSSTIGSSTSSIVKHQIRRASVSTSGCSSSAAACITPDTVTGKAYYLGIIVGGGSAGGTGLSLGPLLGSVQDPSTPTEFASSELLDFSFSSPVTSTGSPTIGGPIPYPSDAQAIVQNAHVYFGYIDIKFTLDSGTLTGTHYLRMVFATITGTDFQKGDILYSSDGTTYVWCTVGSGTCNQSTRPTNPVQNSDIVNYSSTNEGNKTIPSFFANLSSGHAEVQLTESEMTNTAKSWLFTLDFDMTNGIDFSSDPTSLSNTEALASALMLPAEPSSGGSSGGFTVTLTVTDQNAASSSLED